MLRANVQVSAAAAKEYYTEALSRQDYYSEGQDVAGRWGGKGAELLGLTGQVEKEDFNSLCDNQVPGGRVNLTPRTKQNRRVGYDFNFHLPKSASILSQVAGDERIIPEFRKAVAETMAEIEEAMGTRVRKNGDGDRVTGNMIWGEFVHTTGRPVGGVPDCHVHSHNFIFNATWDASEQRWKAGEFGNIKREMEYYEAAFHSRMAARMVALGYEVERMGKFWQVAGVSPELMKKYSRRTDQVEAEAKKRGITDPKLKDYLGGYTREKKSATVPGLDLRKEWFGRLSSDEQTGILEILESAQGRAGSDGEGGAAAERAVAFALAHHFQNQSVVGEKRLLNTALRHALGKTGIDRVKAALSGAAVTRVMREGTAQITTEQAIREEAEMILLSKRYAGKELPFKKGVHVFSRDYLSPSQKAAVQHVLGSRDRLIVIRGGAGTGKTTLMQECIESIHGNGLRVFTFAPTVKARGVLRSDGLAAHTVARLLRNPELQEKLREQVIWVDEAGLLSVPDMLALLRIADKQNARIILSGDERQHSSVARGDALRILRQFAGIKAAEVVEIQRQRGEYKKAIEALSEGKVAEGVGILDGMGSIRELGTGEVSATVAARYSSALKRGKSALIISPTHREGGRVTEAVREQLRQDGSLGKSEWNLIQHVNLNWSDAQKGDSHGFRPGMVIQFVQNATGFEIGDRMVVNEVAPGRIGCARVMGEPARWWIDLEKVGGDRFQVYRSDTIKVARGEKIQITQGGQGKYGSRLENGSIMTVKSVLADGYVEMTNGIKMHHDYGHFNYGYFSTSHAAQGQTVDEVFIAESRESLAVAGREQLYVSASRGRERVEIYTDDKQAMLEAVGLERSRLSATELFSTPPLMEDDTPDNKQPKPAPGPPIGKPVEGTPSVRGDNPGFHKEPEGENRLGKTESKLSAGVDKPAPKQDSPQMGKATEKPSEATLGGVKQSAEKAKPAGPEKRMKAPEAKPSLPPGFKGEKKVIAQGRRLNAAGVRLEGDGMKAPDITSRPKTATAYKAREKVAETDQMQRAKILEVRQKREMMQRSNELAKTTPAVPAPKKVTPIAPGKSAKPAGASPAPAPAGSKPAEPKAKVGKWEAKIQNERRPNPPPPKPTASPKPPAPKLPAPKPPRPPAPGRR